MYSVLSHPLHCHVPLLKIFIDFLRFSVLRAHMSRDEWTFYDYQFCKTLSGVCEVHSNDQLGKCYCIHFHKLRSQNEEIRKSTSIEKSELLLLSVTQFTFMSLRLNCLCGSEL